MRMTSFATLPRFTRKLATLVQPCLLGLVISLVWLGTGQVSAFTESRSLLPPTPCAPAHSINSNTPTAIQFINETDGLVNIWWLDFNGHCVF